MLCRKFGVDVKNFAIDRIPEELSGKSPKEIRTELSKTRSAMSEIGYAPKKKLKVVERKDCSCRESR